MRITANGVTGEVLNWTNTMQYVHCGIATDGPCDYGWFSLAAVILDTGYGIEIVELGNSHHIFKREDEQ
jgi:hypothetical protein